MKRHIILSLLLFFFPVLCGWTQSVTGSDTQWENLKRLKPETKISVRVRPGAELKGRFTGADSTQLYMVFRKEEIRLKRENIKLVIVLNKMNWRPSNLVGGAIGFAIAAALGNYMLSYYGEGYDTTADHLKVTALFGLAGASAGVITAKRVRGPDDSMVIYEAD